MNQRVTDRLKRALSPLARTKDADLGRGELERVELGAAAALVAPAIERLGSWLSDPNPWDRNTVLQHRVELEQERERMRVAARVLGRRIWWAALGRAHDARAVETRRLVGVCACPIGVPFASAIGVLGIEREAGSPQAFALLEGAQALIAAVFAAVGMSEAADEARRYEFADVDVAHFGTYQTQFEAFLGEATAFTAMLPWGRT